MDDMIKRLEDATKGSQELNDAIMALLYRREKRFIGAWEDDGMDENNVRPVKDWVWVDPATDKWVGTHAKPYTTSLDAALTLVPEGWGWSLHCEHGKYRVEIGSPKIALESGPTTLPTLALCIAALRARSQEGG